MNNNDTSITLKIKKSRDKRPMSLRFPVNRSLGILGNPDSKELWNEILDQIPNDFWSRPNLKILNVACGHGTEADLIVARMKQAGVSIPDIKNSIYLLDKYTMFVEVAKDRGYTNVIKEDFLEYETEMKFDLVIGNPPYNASAKKKSDKVIAGTSGNTVLYRKFIEKAFALRKGDGIVCFIVQRTGIRWTANKYVITKFLSDTKKYWDFTAGAFISIGQDNSRIDVTRNTLVSKVYNPLQEHYRYHNAIGGSYSSLLKEGKISHEENTPGSVYGLVELPKKGKDGINEEIWGYIKGAHRKGTPKILFKGLESRNSYLVCDKPDYVGSSCAIEFNSIDDAKKALAFIQNNPIVKYLYHNLSEKSLGAVFRHIKPFDLDQIKNGTEIPKEFDLSDEELKQLR